MSQLENATGMVCAGVAFLGIAGLTWFFSSRRDLFVRFFGMGDADIDQSVPRGDDFRTSMRTIAKLQLAVAAVVELVGLWLWFTA